MSTTMNSSLVFPTSLFQQPLPKHGPLVAASYSTSWYSTSLHKPTMMTKTPRGSTPCVPIAPKTARRALFRAVYTANNNKKNLANPSSRATWMMKRSSVTAATVSASSASSMIRKVLPASLPLQVGVGMASACYWRGMWYILDDQLYPDNLAKSALASVALGTVGLTMTQPILFDITHGKKDCFRWPMTETCKTTVAKKWLALYGLGTSCILIWRGAWVGCDVVYEHFTNENPLDPKHLTISGLASHGLALVGLMAMGRLHCVLGPPYHGSLTYKDEDVLNTRHLRKMAGRSGGNTRTKFILPLLEQGSNQYGKLLNWLPDKTTSIGVRKI